MRGLLVLVATIALVGCTDTDGDGTRDAKDCDPLDKSVHPEAVETCNGRDDNCNGQVDEDVAIVAYWDRDLDGWGDAAFARRVCTLPADGSEKAGDCDDLDPQTHPEAEERCDEVDNDCDGEIDEDVGIFTFYADADGDGAGDPAVTLSDCIAPAGYVGNSDDCDDTAPTIWIGATEICDGLDNDCDGSADEDLAIVRVYTDADGDGSGDPASPALACGPLPGLSLDDRDCDDTDPARGGNAAEVQGNAVDEDCDGYVDEYGVPVPYATWLDAAVAIGGPGTGTEVIQFDDGWHTVNVDAPGSNYIFAGEGCGRTTLYAASADPVMQLDGGAVEGLTLAGGTGATGGGLRIEGGSVRATGICVEDNAANLRGGGVGVLDQGTLVLEDSRVVGNQANEIGGGVYAGEGSTIELIRTEVVGNTATVLWGGGVGTRGGHLEIHNSVVAGNLAGQLGGGIYVANGTAPDMPGGPDVHWDGSANIQFTTVHGNLLDPAWGLQGTGLLVGGTTVELHHSTFTGHPDPIDVVSTKSSGLLGVNRTASLTSTDNAFRGNGWYELDNAWYLGAIRGEPGFANADPARDPADWDLRLTVDSEWIDATTDATAFDVDGSPADLGAWGGPLAWWDPAQTPLWRPRPQPDSGFVDDLEGDGLLDSWEGRYGTSPILDDGAEDPDADGLDNLAEQALRTHPTLADTDADGVDDPTEDAAGSDPRSPADNRPLAGIGPDKVALVGSAVVLSGATSIDPNGDALTFSWAVTGAPFGSTAAVADPTAMDASFTPDLPGSYTLELTVSDGQGAHSASRQVDARTGVIVPDDAATLQEAVALTYDGQGIFVRAGTWGSVDLSGRALAIVGLDGPSAVVLDAAGTGPVVRGDSGDLVLAGLTLTGGNSDAGGGVRADGASSLTLRDVVLHDNVAAQGGAIYALDAAVDGAWLEIFDNIAGEGAGIWISGADSSLAHARMYRNGAWQGGALWLDAGIFAMDHLELQSNSASDGGALWCDDTCTALLDNSAVAGNKGGSAVFSNTGFVYSRSVLWIEDETAEEAQTGQPIYTFDAVNPALWRPMNNFSGGDATFWYLPGILAARAAPLQPGDPMVGSWIDNGNPDDDLLIGRIASPLVDAGWPEWLDPDGSRPDIGLAGGPDAAVGGAMGQWDTDGDGLDDAWEVRFGMDRFDPADVALDVDGDGWNALDEYVAGTNPQAADSDGDGIDDVTELTGGGDPTSMEDQRPVALAVAGPTTIEGQLHSLDGSASFDPFFGPSPLSYTWRAVVVPPGSVITTGDLSDPAAAAPTFVPDIGGRYLFGLRVTDGNLVSHEVFVELKPGRVLEVPSEYAAINDAYAAAEPGDRVRLDPGIHDLNQVDWLDGVAIEGSGVDQTFVHGLAGRAIFEIDSGETAVIRDLTLAGANGNYGGAIDCAYGTLTLERVRFEWNTSHDGGGMRSWHCDTVFVDVDFYDNDAASRGGALAVTEGTFSWTRGVVARNASDGVGGGLFVDNSDAVIRNVIFHHNESESGGGAINQIIQYDPGDPYDPYDDEIPQLLLLEHLTVAGNNGRNGGLYLNRAEVRNSIVQENNNFGLFMSNTAPEAWIDASFNAIWGNLSGDADGANITLSSTTGADAHFIAFDPYDGGGWIADFHLPLASPVRDTGTTLTGMDPDGSLPDPGAYGGPDAPADWDDHQADSDGDGMADLWELQHGLDPANGTDGGNDADLDGLSNKWEHDNFTDPNSADSDADGVADVVEVGAGDDPANPADHAPVADPGGDVSGAAVGVQRGLNGLLSYDPDGDPITAWQWSLVAKPGRSALTDLDLTNPDTQIVTFTPDSPGTYEIALVITAGGVPSAPVAARVTVNGTVLVPEDYPTVAQAIAGVNSGHAVDIAAGTWPTAARLGGKSVTLIGAGRDLTILDAEGMGSVIRGDNGEQLTIQDLTITNGLAAEGGGVHLEGSGGVLTLTDATVSNSASIYGGGVYVRNGSLVTTRARIVDNHSGRNGGGIYTTSTDVDLFQTLVAGNLSVALHGGGINHYNGAMTVANCIFHDNWTEQHGGAMYLNGTDDGVSATMDVFISQSSFTQNYAEDEGGAIKFYKANLDVWNTLFAHNDGDEAAVQNQDLYNEFNSAYLLFEDNTASHFDLTDNMAIVAPADGDANGNLVDRTALLSGLSDNGDWTDDDWTPAPGSAAIDAGDPAVLDLDGSPSDIGATGGPDGDWIP